MSWKVSSEMTPHAWKHYVAMGDSLTQGYGDPVAGLASMSWADRLAEALRPLHPDFRYDKLAKRGMTSQQIVETQLPFALAAKPDLVSVLAGGNDLFDSNWQIGHTEANLRKLVGPFVEAGATVIVFTMNDNSPMLPREIAAQRQPVYDGIRAINRIVRQLSREYDLLRVDMEHNQELQDNALWSSDLIHANMRGHIVLAAETAYRLGRYAGITIQSESLLLPEQVQV
jgi:lysophospholipase L1-like esterase